MPTQADDDSSRDDHVTEALRLINNYILNYGDDSARDDLKRVRDHLNFAYYGTANHSAEHDYFTRADDRPDNGRSDEHAARYDDTHDHTLYVCIHHDGYEHIIHGDQCSDTYVGVPRHLTY